MFAEHVDVVVCDGFVGNIMLKSWESLVRFFTTTAARRSSGRTPCAPAGPFWPRAPSARSSTASIPSGTEARRCSACAATILKAHGSSNRHAIKSAVLAADQLIRADLGRHTESDIAKANDILGRAAAV